MCWFDLVRNMWGFLSTSHAPNNANENLSNKPYFCLGLLANLADILRPVYFRLIILGFFDPFLPSLYGIPLDKLDDCWGKKLKKIDMFWNLLEYGRSITSDTNTTFLTGNSCNWGTECDNVSIFLLLSGVTIGIRVGVLLLSSSIYGVNQVSLRSILSGAPIYYMRCTISIKFEDIVTSLMNGTVENSSSNTTWNWGDTWPVDRFITIATYPAWNSECTRYISSHDRGSHLGSPDKLPCNISSKT